MFPGLSASVPAELGTTDDPRAMVPGNPDAILAKLATLTKLSAGIDEASSAFTRIDAEQWQGTAGDSFRQAFSQEVPHWHDSAAAFDAVRTALQDYGHTLQAAQGQAAGAIELFNRGVQATKTAQAQYDAQQRDAQTAQGAAVPPLAPFSDPGAADRQEARAKLDDARKAVRNSGDNAAHAIGVQRDSAPQGPGPLERAWAAVTETGASLVNADWHAAGGAAGAVGDIAKPLAALNPLAAFTHPMGFADNVANTGTGLLHAANHPVQLAKGMVDVDDWGNDPAAAIGKAAVNIGSLFAGGDGAAAKGAEIGTHSAEVAGVADKAAGQAGNIGKSVEEMEEAGHPSLKPADWAPPIPDSGTPFGPQGSQSLLHDPPPPAEHAQADHPLLDQPVHHDAPGHTPQPPPQEYAANSGFHASATDHQALRDHIGDGAFHPRVLEELHERLHDFHPDAGKIPDEELVGMQRYTGIHHMDINQALREGDPSALHNLDPEIKNAASGMNRLPDWQGTTGHPVVYRGIDVDPGNLPDLLSRYGDHEMVTEPGFTSGDKENAYPGNVQFIIEPRYGKDLEFLNPYGGMKEVCWPPGNSFEVLGRRFDEAGGQWKIYLKDHGR